MKTIKRDIAQMQNDNIITRVGSKKSGYWKIVCAENDTLNDTLNDILNDTLNNRTRTEKIVTLIQEKPTITQLELAKELEVSIDTIKRDIAQMQDDNIITRIGSKKSGYWDVLQKK